jgi:tRNA 2-selenouridine synthase
MREPFKTPINQVLAQLPQYDDIIDVRAPSEFALDHLPGAINLPVLDDDQRHLVGLTHKEQGAFAGSRLGAPMVAANIAHWLQTTFADKSRLWRPLVYCWRGGQRSGAMATILARVGWKTEVLEGGYREYRRYVCDYFEQSLTHYRFIILAGRTGTAKSGVLAHLASLGQQVLDLEGLANHKGSVLGQVPGSEQPSQKRFESLLWQQLTSFDPNRPVFVESESKKVGRVHVPDQLMLAMRQSEVITVNASVDWRVQYLLRDYHYFTQDDAWLFQQLDCLVGLHSLQTINEWKGLASNKNWAQFVGTLLTEHYDPAYDKAIKRNFKSTSGLASVELTDPDFNCAAAGAAKQISISLNADNAIAG